MLIYRDTSGQSLQVWAISDVGTAAIAAAGYMGTPLWGALLLVATPTPRAARRALLVLAAMMVVTAFTAVQPTPEGDSFGVYATLGIAAALAACAIVVPGRWRVLAAHFIAAQACINALLDIRVLLRPMQVVERHRVGPTPTRTRWRSRRSARRRRGRSGSGRSSGSRGRSPCCSSRCGSSVDVPVRARLHVATMDEQTFWNMIEASRHVTRDPVERAEILIGELASRPLADIEEFQVILDRVRAPAITYRLWSAGEVIFDGCSSDSFWYFISWVIGLGRHVLANACADPDSLANVPEVRVLASNGSGEDWPEWEALNYVARRAYDRATGRDDQGLVAALEARGHVVAGDPAPSDDPDVEYVWPHLTALFRSRR